MLIKNVDETLVNGSMGIVKRFVDPAKYSAEQTDDILGKNKDAKGKKDEGPPRADKLVPLVEFSTPGGGKRPILVLPEEWKVELPSGEIQARRQQVRLFTRIPLKSDVVLTPLFLAVTPHLELGHVDP